MALTTLPLGLETMKNDVQLNNLIAATDARCLDAIRRALPEIEQVQLNLEWTGDFDQAEESLQHGHHDVYFLDQCAGGHDWLEVLRAHGDVGEAQIMLVSDQASIAWNAEALSAGALGCVSYDLIDECWLARILKRVARHKRMTLALSENERRLREVIEIMPVMLLAYNPDATRIIFWNQECERVTGYPAQEIIGHPRAGAQLYPDDTYRLHLRDEWERRGDNYRDWEWEITCKDGSVKTVAWSNISARAPIAGWGTWAVGVDVTERKRLEEALRKAHDELEQRVEERTAELAQVNVMLRQQIAEREQAEAALRESEERLRQVVQNMPVMMIAWNEDARLITAWNRECERVTGYSAEEIVSNPTYVKLIYPDTDYLLRLWAEWVQRGDDYRDMEWDITCKDGSVKTVAWSNISARFPIPGWGTWAIGVDVTERKRAEERALELAIERERVNVLERFIGDASHDLKTPLTAMKVSLSVLKRSPGPEKEARHLAILEAQTAHLERLLEDMLSAVRLDQPTAYVRRRLDLNELGRIVAAEHESLAERKGHRLSFEPADGSPIVNADVEKLNRAMAALVTNALNYTLPGGNVMVRTAVRGASAVIEVEDTGIGIEAFDLPHIFDRFYRADAARSAEVGGTGLGLAIAKTIIEAHQGRIEVKTTPGAGSRFTVYLPIAEGDA